MTKIMWCIECEQEVVQEIHHVYYPNLDEWEFCDGNEGDLLCSCPPPDEPDESYQAWLDTLISF